MTPATDQLAPASAPAATYAVQAMTAPPAWMVGARTRMLDCWAPQHEWIRMPGLAFEARDYHVFRAGEPAAAGDANALTLGQPFYDARRWGASNIAHAIIRSAIPALAARRACESAGDTRPFTVILPANAAPYVRAVYEILGLQVVTTAAPVRGEAFETDFDPHACVSLAGQFLPADLAASLEQRASEFPRRLHIARRGARAITNLNEIEPILQREDYVTIYPERLPVIDQFRHLWHAEEVVGVHGAGLAALLLRALMRPQRPLRLIELFGPGYVVTLYRHVVAALGGRWIGVRGRVTPEVVGDLDIWQGRRLWPRIRRSLRGVIPARFFRMDRDWQRHHQASDFELDPDSLSLAIQAVRQDSPEPPVRELRF